MSLSIRFLGIEPSKSFKDWAARHEIAVTDSSPKKGESRAELLVFAPRKDSDLKDLPRIREANPDTWLAVVLKSSSLKKADVQQLLADHVAYDDVWPKESWEILCLLALPRWLRQRALAEKLATSEAQCRELRANCSELSSRSEKLIDQLERDVALAQSLHRALLPRAAPKVTGLDIAAKHVPGAGPGGDYYDVFEFGDRKRFGFLVADSRSHGMAAALLTILIKIRLEEMKERFPDSRSFVTHLNDEIQAIDRKELARLSLLYGMVDRTTLTFQYTVAGNLSAHLWRLGELTTLGSVANPALGELNRHEFRESVVTLKPGDLLLLFTSGMELTLKEGNTDVNRRLAEILTAAEPVLDPLDVQTRLMALVSKRAETEPLASDVTLVQLRVPKGALYIASESK